MRIDLEEIEGENEQEIAEMAAAKWEQDENAIADNILNEQQLL